MLVLGRRPGEGVYITTADGRRIVVEVLGVDGYGTAVRIGLTAPESIPIDRAEVRDRKNAARNPGESNG
jgi:carbon storage regulator CsrA